MTEYNPKRSKTSYPCKGRPTKGSKGQVKRLKPERLAPGTGLEYDDDVRRQMMGDYKKPANRRDDSPAPMRVLTTLYG